MYSLNTTSAIVRLIQISDTHLFDAKSGLLLGMQTLQSLEAVLHSVRLKPQPIDAILVTGDLSQDGSLGSYQHLQQALTPFQSPVFWLAGNHDDYHVMQQAAVKHEYLQTVIRTDFWQLILLNSQSEGAVFGELSIKQLEILQDALQQRPDLHSVICLHHQPIAMGCRWLDKIGLRNAVEFQAVLQQHQNVRAVLWGHVHQESSRFIDGVRYLSTPSTCVQFKPNATDFSLDELAPGYRWLDLHPDGAIETGVSRVEGIKLNVNLHSQGY